MEVIPFLILPREGSFRGPAGSFQVQSGDHFGACTERAEKRLGFKATGNGAIQSDLSTTPRLRDLVHVHLAFALVAVAAVVSPHLSVEVEA